MAVKYEKYLIGSKIICPHMSVNNFVFVFDVSFGRDVSYDFDGGFRFYDSYSRFDGLVFINAALAQEISIFFNTNRR